MTYLSEFKVINNVHPDLVVTIPQGRKYKTFHVMYFKDKRWKFDCHSVLTVPIQGDASDWVISYAHPHCEGCSRVLKTRYTSEEITQRLVPFIRMIYRLAK